MNLWIKTLFGGVFLLLLSCSGQILPQGVQELEMKHEPYAGTQNIEVLEFMWLGCPHCQIFHKNWVSLKRQFADSGVSFASVPAPFDSWHFDARVHLAFEELGLMNDGLLANYYAVRQGPEGKAFASDPEKAAQWLSQRYDTSKDDFLEIFGSSLLENRLQEIEEMIDKYPVRGVPAFLVSVIDTQKSYFIPYEGENTEKTIQTLLESFK